MKTKTLSKKIPAGFEGTVKLLIGGKEGSEFNITIKKKVKKKNKVIRRNVEVALRMDNDSPGRPLGETYCREIYDPVLGEYYVVCVER